jgi:hypothetical protein
MPSLRSLLPAAVLAVSLAAPGAASAQRQPSDCQLMQPRPAKEYAIPGTSLVARDPYGGRLSRNRLFFDFSVVGPKADLAGVAKVTWALDGTVVREDPTAPFEWKGVSGSSRRMPAGDHVITVTVTPKSGQPASTQFPLTATDCQNASFSAYDIPKRTGTAELTWQSAFETDGEPLDAVSVSSSRNVAAALPARLRRRKIGTLTLLRSANAKTGKTYTLTAPRGATKTVLHRGRLQVVYRPGARGFLDVRHLPAGVQIVRVHFVSGVVHVRDPRKAYGLYGKLVAGTRTAVLFEGGRYA